jgi:hypothetical protein
MESDLGCTHYSTIHCSETTLLSFDKQWEIAMIAMSRSKLSSSVEDVFLGGVPRDRDAEANYFGAPVALDF